MPEANSILTRAPMGYFYNVPPLPLHWGKLLTVLLSPPISETTVPICKMQTAFDSPTKFVERNLTLSNTGPLMTSQITGQVKEKQIDFWNTFTHW